MQTLRLPRPAHGECRYCRAPIAYSVSEGWLGNLSPFCSGSADGLHAPAGFTRWE